MDTVALKRKLACFEAQKWIGIKEVGGPNRGQIVEIFQRAIDGKAQGEPWCAAFVGFVLKTVEDTFQALEIEAQPCALTLSEHVMTMWAKAPADKKLSKPEVGSLVVWQMYSKEGKATGSGHIGLVTRLIGEKFETVEGNTNDGLGVEREGVGVFKRVRSHVVSGPMRVMGYLRAW